MNNPTNMTDEMIADEIANDPTQFLMEWNSMSSKAHANSRDKGFWDNPQDPAVSIALMHSELSEALEALRKPHLEGHLYEKGHTLLEEEMADVVIRIMDFSRAHRLNVGAAIVAKMRYNRGREKMHGDKKF